MGRLGLISSFFCSKLMMRLCTLTHITTPHPRFNTGPSQVKMKVSNEQIPSMCPSITREIESDLSETNDVEMTANRLFDKFM